MKQKILTLIMALTMVLTIIPAAGAQAVIAADAVDEFKDTTAETVNTTAYNSIYWAVGEGIIKGFDDGSFRPTASCTREQFVVMIWRLEGKPSATAKVSFTDIDSSRSTIKAIQWAVNKDIIKGFSDGSFKPEDTVTRQQIAIMLWRMAGKPSAGSSADFNDITSSTSGYDAIQWGAAAGLIKGFSDGSFDPAKDCQRQQIAIFLARYAKNLEGKDTTAPEVKKTGEENTAEPVGVIDQLKDDAQLISLLRFNALMGTGADPYFDYKNELSEGQHFRIIQDILQLPLGVVWKEGYPMPAPEYIMVNEDRDPLGKLTPGTMTRVAEEEPLVWVVKNIYNLSDKVIEESKTTIIEGEAFSAPGKGVYGYYYYDGKYYMSTTVGSTGEIPEVEIIEAIQKGDYYYVKYVKIWKYGEEESRGKETYAVLQKKDLDLGSFWSIYTLSFEDFVEP